MQTIHLINPPDVEHFGRWLLRLAEHHPDLLLTLQKQGKGLRVGILNFEPEEEDWFQRPVDIDVDLAMTEVQVGIDKGK